MPSLVAFGRRWRIASDDFFFPALTEVAVRVIWLATVCILFVLNNPVHCPSVDFITYLILLVVLNIVGTILAAGLAWCSSRGHILQPSARRHVTTLLYIRLPLFVVEFICTIFSTILASQDDDVCHFKFGIRLTVFFQWAVYFVLFIGIIIIFNPSKDTYTDQVERNERRLWTRRLKIVWIVSLQCSIGQDQAMRAALDDIAFLMASFFADVDLVASDILAGLLLLVHTSHDPLPNDELLLSDQPPSWMTLENARRMIKFATAVYGWPAYCFNNCGCVAWCRLWKRLNCCSSCRCNTIPVIDDNCCFCSTASFAIVSEIELSDVYFVCFRNKLYQVPFIVLVDSQTRSIVIAIRGSASLMDLVTDLSLDEEIFSVDVDADPILGNDENLEGDGEEVRVHRGMLRSARYVLETLKQHNILDELEGLYPNYNIVVCGHSLGAGVATLLTLLLKKTYESIQCYAFSPPGCVISENGLEETSQYVFSIVVGDDIVPRTSFQTLHKLKYSIIDALIACNSAKYEIIIRGCFRLFFSAPWQSSVNTSALPTGAFVVPVDDCLPLVFHNSLTTTNHEYGRLSNVGVAPAEQRRHRVQLLPPGRILHLCVKDGVLVTNWISHKALDEIKLSSVVISDHMPYYVKKVLQMNPVTDM
uniref:sn-1-specific diacylglycerol lipase n=1 Tax=Syphacia muris TaxID=451379 RepID=A0A158R4X7_9BILA